VFLEEEMGVLLGLLLVLARGFLRRLPPLLLRVLGFRPPLRFGLVAVSLALPLIGVLRLFAKLSALALSGVRLVPLLPLSILVLVSNARLMTIPSGRLVLMITSGHVGFVKVFCVTRP
jgi:hypothetical protein